MTVLMAASVGEKEEAERAKKVAEYRKEVSRKASMANKRIERLEKADAKDSPAYKRYVKEGSVRFGVKGKNPKELQKEVARLDKFLNSQTSTIRGLNANLKEIAKTTGIKYKKVSELRQLTAKFFDLTSKIQQYLRTVDDMASAIGYQEIWEAINQYTQENKINLAEGEDKLDEMLKAITNAITTKESKLKAPLSIRWHPLR